MFWTLAGTQLIGKRGVVPKGRKMQTMLSLGFGKPGTTLTGSIGGDVYIWSENQVSGSSAMFILSLTQVAY